MSRENVGIVQGLHRAFEVGDWVTWRESIHPDVVYYEAAVAGLDTADVIRGRDQLRHTFESFGADYYDFGGSVLEMADVGDRVFCLTEWSGIGRQSGVPLEFVEAIVWTLRDRLVVEGRVFTDRRAALEAVGLSE